MYINKANAENGIIFFDQTSVSASRKERDKADALSVPLKEKSLLPELYRQYDTDESDSGPYVLHSSDLNTLQEFIFQPLPEKDNRQGHEIEHRFLLWEKTVGNVTGKNPGKGLLVNIIV